MLRYLFPALIAFAASASAEVPKVATDIAPVQGLVAAVMGDLGEPGLVVPRGSSPHDHALRPSEARLLQEAGLVVWVGAELMPNLVKPLDSLAPDAAILTLADVPGTHLMSNRANAVFAGSKDHDHSHGGGAAGGSDDGHADVHAQGSHDPHLWLDPGNALVWLDAIAGRLSRIDPVNGDTYSANARRAKDDIARAVADAEARLAPVRHRPFIALHDAYQYFEHAFDLHPLGAIALSDASGPGPARLAELRDTLAPLDSICVLAEPGDARGLLNAIGPAERLRIREVDSHGAQIAAGPGYFPALITATAERIADCLTP